MRNVLILGLTVVAALAIMSPAEVNAYGAAHVGYTHVGPNGVYHTGETVARGPEGTAATGHTTAYGAGGSAYHSGSAAATTGGAYHYGATTTGYHYTPTYSGSAAYHGDYHYGYVR